MLLIVVTSMRQSEISPSYVAPGYPEILWPMVRSKLFVVGLFTLALDQTVLVQLKILPICSQNDEGNGGFFGRVQDQTPRVNDLRTHSLVL